MLRFRLAHSLIGLLLLAAPACQSFYSYRPMTVQVRDAETGQPISGAAVHISYPLMHASQAPYDSVDATNGDGVVYLRAAAAGSGGALVETKAHGYLWEQQSLSAEMVQAIKPAGWLEDIQARPPSLTITMYAEPRPAVELVLPAGFRGVLQVEVQTDPQAPKTPGQRLFTATVPVTGKVDIAGPPLLGRVAAIDYRARYPDGQPLSRDAKGLDIGFWGLNADGCRLTFLVGTRDEFETKRREALANDAAPHGPASSGTSPRGGGRHGGRGGGGRGGQGQSDTAPAMGGI